MMKYPDPEYKNDPRNKVKFPFNREQVAAMTAFEAKAAGDQASEIMKGLNIDSTLELARAVPIPVIASGGLASMDDIHHLMQSDCRILEGAISGRALYDGRINVPVALGLLRGVR